MKTISIVNQKGGVGKTTTAINLATAFAAISRKTLLIDLDPQGNASTGLSVNDRTKNIYDILTSENVDAIKESCVPQLFVIPATVDLSAAEIDLMQVDRREFVLKEAIHKIKNDFEIIIIDCPPSLGLLTINALCASNSIIIPLQCEFFALEGLSHLLKTLERIKANFNQDLKIDGIALTMHDKRNNLTAQVEEDVREHLGELVYKSFIPRNVKLSEAPSHGIPAIIYDSKCPGSDAYINLAKEIIDREKEKQAKIKMPNN